MMKNRILFLILTHIILLYPGDTGSVQAEESGAERFGKPNIILILADDLGYGELSCQGNPQIPTPHIDLIASHGVRMTSGYVTGPNCSPSRAGLLTGLIPTRFGHEFNPIGEKNEEPGYGLPVTQVTIADLLQKSGYVTGILGKWHLGGSAAYHPYRRGFDEFFGFTHEGHYFVPQPWDGVTTMLRRKVLPGGGQGLRAFGKVIYGTHMNYNEPDYDANNPIVRGSQPINEKEYLTDSWTREAVSFIDRHQDKPFFLYISHNAVHSPLQGADPYMEKFSHIKNIQRRIFAAMLANLDDSVGEILKTIKEKNLEEETLIVFLSDNGGPTRELTSSNLPLRGEKGQMYEGAIRIPFMMSWKNKLPEGVVYSHPVSSLDLFPTFLDIAGSEENPDTDGVNLLPFLTGETNESPHETLFWRQGVKTAIRHQDWKLLRHQKNPSRNTWELYNVKKDISESNNLVTTEPEQFQKLLQIWEGLNSEMVEPAFR